jgi:hypothetical protein
MNEPHSERQSASRGIAIGSGLALLVLLTAAITWFVLRDDDEIATDDTVPTVTTAPSTTSAASTTAAVATSAAATTEPDATTAPATTTPIATSPPTAAPVTTAAPPAPPIGTSQGTATVTFESAKATLGEPANVATIGGGEVSWQPDGRIAVLDETLKVTIHTLDGAVVSTTQLPTEAGTSVPFSSGIAVGPDDVLYVVYEDGAAVTWDVLAVPTTGPNAGIDVARYPLGDCTGAFICFGPGFMEATGVRIDDTLVPYVDPTGAPSGKTVTVPEPATAEYAQVVTSDLPGCGTFRMTVTRSGQSWVIEAGPTCEGEGPFAAPETFVDGTVLTQFALFDDQGESQQVLAVMRADGTITQYSAECCFAYASGGAVYTTEPNDDQTLRVVRRALG